MSTETQRVAHTPGPWLFRVKSDDVYTAPEEGTAYSYGKFMFGFNPDFLPCDADLSLILAAPELLEACKTFAEWLRREEAGYPDVARRFDADGNATPEGEKAWREWFNENLRLCDLSQTLAHEAIAKATGGAL